MSDEWKVEKGFPVVRGRWLFIPEKFFERLVLDAFFEVDCLCDCITPFSYQLLYRFISMHLLESIYWTRQNP